MAFNAPTTLHHTAIKYDQALRQHEAQLTQHFERVNFNGIDVAQQQIRMRCTELGDVEPRKRKQGRHSCR